MRTKISSMTEKSPEQGRLIAVDAPFDYDEVVAYAGLEYVQNLQRDGMSCMAYDDVKKKLPGFYLAEEECIWMKAGIINFRVCDNHYNCDDCDFDKAMKIAMGGNPASEMGRFPVKAQRESEDHTEIDSPCIHFLSGRINTPFECGENYECYQCAVHKRRGEKKAVMPATEGQPSCRVVSGHLLHSEYYYHFGHTWVKVMDGAHVRIGMDDFASSVFGRAEKISLPKLGESINQGRLAWSMERDGRRASIQSPLTGNVLTVNGKAIEDPAIIHNDPYEKGWLLELQPHFLERELNTLFSGKDCSGWVDHENRLLLGLLGPEYENLAATGGKANDDFFGNFPESGWERLVHMFLERGAKV